MKKNDFNNNIIELRGNCLFVSDAHFQVPASNDDRNREQLLISMLKQHENLDHLFLLGDIFDFWFEYRDVAPKGYFNLFHYLDKLNKNGTTIHFFTGNHDMWIRNYFTESFGAITYFKPQIFLINDKKFIIGHGDGIGGKQRKYLLIKSILNFNPNKVLYSSLHPRIAFSLARYCSRKSRSSHSENDSVFKAEAEFQVAFARDILRSQSIDYFIFGHRHIPTLYKLDENTIFYNTGDWINNFSFVKFYVSDIWPELTFFNSKENLDEH